MPAPQSTHRHDTSSVPPPSSIWSTATAAHARSSSAGARCCLNTSPEPEVKDKSNIDSIPRGGTHNSVRSCLSYLMSNLHISLWLWHLSTHYTVARPGEVFTTGHLKRHSVDLPSKWGTPSVRLSPRKTRLSGRRCALPVQAVMRSRRNARNNVGIFEQDFTLIFLSSGFKN